MRCEICLSYKHSTGCIYFPDWALDRIHALEARLREKEVLVEKRTEMASEQARRALDLQVSLEQAESERDALAVVVGKMREAVEVLANAECVCRANKIKCEKGCPRREARKLLSLPTPSVESVKAREAVVEAARETSERLEESGQYDTAAGQLSFGRNKLKDALAIYDGAREKDARECACPECAHRKLRTALDAAKKVMEDRRG